MRLRVGDLVLYGMSLKRSELAVFRGTKTVTDNYGRDDAYDTFWNVAVGRVTTTYPWRGLLRRVDLPAGDQ
jgi:hypothetical protein